MEATMITRSRAISFASLSLLFEEIINYHHRELVRRSTSIQIQRRVEFLL